MIQRQTTIGYLRWNDTGHEVKDFDDPIEPEGKGWEMTGSCLGEFRYSEQPILWFWRREI